MPQYIINNSDTNWSLREVQRRSNLKTATLLAVAHSVGSSFVAKTVLNRRSSVFICGQSLFCRFTAEPEYKKPSSIKPGGLSVYSLLQVSDYRPSCLKKSFPLSSTRINAGKFSTSIFHTASIPSSGKSIHSTFLMFSSASSAAGPPMEPR